MKPEDICIGDTLRIRDWDDMALEYGIGEFTGSVLTPKLSFVKIMSHLCGQNFTVKSTYSVASAICYRSVEGIEDNDSGAWYITPEMLERPDDEAVDIIASDEALFKFLNS